MDTITLVDELVEDGRRLIDSLVQEHIPVIMACWVKPVEEDRWSLYLATPLLDKKGAKRAYRDVFQMLRSLENSWVTDSHISLIGQDDPITKDVLDIQRKLPGRVPTRTKRPRLGNLTIEEAYIYPPPTTTKGWPRLSFRVSYDRQGTTDLWTTSTEPGRLYRGINASGAISYSTSWWEGENADAENNAQVSVLMEIDPRHNEQILVLPEVRQMLAQHARGLADKMFKSKHPEAAIEHSEED